MDDLDVLVSEAKTGHPAPREALIARFRPLILRIAANLRGQYIDVYNDDEITIGMLAIDEAIKSFDPAAGARFSSFVETVIKRRLIDYYRREQREKQVIVFSGMGEEKEDMAPTPLDRLEFNLAVAEFQKEIEQNERKEEIRQYTQLLNQYGISFRELVSASPKHEDARMRAISVAKLVANEQELRNYLQTKKELPLKQLALRTKVSRKTMERQRKYIIALALILLGDFHYLKTYLGNAW